MNFGSSVAQISVKHLVWPKAVLFDWDNTLIDSWAAIHDAQNHTLVAFGLEPWTSEETRSRVRGSMRDTYPKLFGSRWREAGKIFYDRFAAKHLKTLSPLPGVENLLQELHSTGTYLAVVSNKAGNYLRKEVVYLGWHAYFDRIVGAFDAAQDKPAVDPVDLALRDSGISRGSEVWFVGDADIDLECAKNAGCTSVLVRESAPETGEFEDDRPALYVDSCLTLSKILQKL